MNHLKITFLTPNAADYRQNVNDLHEQISTWGSFQPQVTASLKKDWEEIYRLVCGKLKNAKLDKDIFTLTDPSSNKAQGAAITERFEGSYHINYLITAPWNLQNLDMSERKRIGSKLILLICIQAMKMSYSHISVVPINLSSGVASFYSKLQFESSFPPAEQMEMAIPAYRFPAVVFKLKEQATEMEMNIEFTPRETMGTRVPWILKDIIKSEKNIDLPWKPNLLFEEICKLQSPLSPNNEEYIDHGLLLLSREMTEVITHIYSSAFWFYDKTKGKNYESLMSDPTTYQLTMLAHHFYSEKRRVFLDDTFAYFIFLNLKISSNPHSVVFEKLPISKVLSNLEVTVPSQHITHEQLPELWLRTAVNLLFGCKIRLEFQDALNKNKNPWKSEKLTALMESQSVESKHLALMLSGYFALLCACGRQDKREEFQEIIDITRNKNLSDGSMPFVQIYLSMIECEHSIRKSVGARA